MNYQIRRLECVLVLKIVDIAKFVVEVVCTICLYCEYFSLTSVHVRRTTSVCFGRWQTLRNNSPYRGGIAYKH